MINSVFRKDLSNVDTYFVAEIYFLLSFSQASIWGHSGSVLEPGFVVSLTPNHIASCGSSSTTTSNMWLNVNDFNKASKLIVRCVLIWLFDLFDVTSSDWHWPQTAANTTDAVIV